MNNSLNDGTAAREPVFTDDTPIDIAPVVVEPGTVYDAAADKGVIDAARHAKFLWIFLPLVALWVVLI